MNNIRVTYSGLLAFTVGLGSILTGLIFTLIVTRRLSPEEFGTWSLIGSLISYFIISEMIINYWTVREIARGDDVGRTSFMSGLIFSVAVIPFYFILASSISNQSDAALEPMILGAILIPLIFASRVLNSINTGFKPQITSYGLVIFETIKIPVALLLVYFLDLKLEGAIITVAIALLFQIFVQIYFARSKLRGKFQFESLKRWIKLSWISLYSAFPQLIFSVDIAVFILITGSVVGVAYYSASLAIAFIVFHAGKISQALLPKLVAKGSYQHIRENFILLMFTAIPLLGVSIIFSKPALFALNPIYEGASLVVMFLAGRTFLFVMNNTLLSVLEGIEKVDENKNVKFSKLLRSQLFFSSTIRYLRSGIYIGLLIPILLIAISSNYTELDLVILWSVVSLSTEIPFFIYLWIFVHKKVSLPFPFVNTVKYIFSTMAFISVFFITSEHLIIYHISIFDFLPGVIAQLAICVSIYIAITYSIDNKTRNLFKNIINELLKRNKNFE